MPNGRNALIDVGEGRQRDRALTELSLGYTWDDMYNLSGGVVTQGSLTPADGRGIRFRDNLDPLLERRIAFGGDRRALIDFLTNGLTDPRAARAQPPFDHPALSGD